jgi:hypothetical protein
VAERTVLLCLLSVGGEGVCGWRGGGGGEDVVWCHGVDVRAVVDGGCRAWLAIDCFGSKVSIATYMESGACPRT